MAQQVTALINFKHCDFGEDFAKATAAYDSDPQTAWIASFTIAQRAYWAQQGGGLINGYAEAYAVGRNNSISNAAQSAYVVCMAGGASAFLAPVVEPSFKLVVQTKLDGGSSSGGITSVSAGPSAQLSVPFSPAATAQDQVLDWKAFYRVGSIQLDYNYATNWVMSYPSGGGYTLPSYTTLPMIPSINVDAENLVSISADLAQYIDVPAGMFATTPDNLIADFTAVQSFFSFTLQRRVVLPDGQIIQNEIDYDNGFNNGILADVSATVYFPELGASCDVSGTVDVYHFITAYAFGTLYKLANKVQQVRVDGSDYDFAVWANAAGSTPPSYGPPGFNSIHESFYFSATPVFNLGIVRVKYFQAGIFQYQKIFLVWNGTPVDPGLLVNMTSDATETKFYGKHLTETSSTSESISLSGGTTLNGTYTVPIIEDMVVNNFETGTLTITPSVSTHVEYLQSIIKIKNVLKPLATYTPYGPFVTEQPSYQATGNFLSVLPDFVDYINWKALIGILRVRHYGLYGDLFNVGIYLIYKGESGPPSHSVLYVGMLTTGSLGDFASRTTFTVRLYGEGPAVDVDLDVIEDASCTQRLRWVTEPARNSGVFYYWADPANPSVLTDDRMVGIPGYPYSTSTVPYSWGEVTVTRSSVDVLVGSSARVTPHGFSYLGGAYTIAKLSNVLCPTSVPIGSSDIRFSDRSLSSSSTQPYVNVKAYNALQLVDDFFEAPVGNASPGGIGGGSYSPYGPYSHWPALAWK